MCRHRHSAITLKLWHFRCSLGLTRCEDGTRCHCTERACAPNKLNLYSTHCFARTCLSMNVCFFSFFFVSFSLSVFNALAHSTALGPFFTSFCVFVGRPTRQLHSIGEYIDYYYCYWWEFRHIFYSMFVCIGSDLKRLHANETLVPLVVLSVFHEPIDYKCDSVGRGDWNEWIGVLSNGHAAWATRRKGHWRTAQSADMCATQCNRFWYIWWISIAISVPLTVFRKPPHAVYGSLFVPKKRTYSKPTNSD